MIEKEGEGIVTRPTDPVSSSLHICFSHSEREPHGRPIMEQPASKQASKAVMGPKYKIVSGGMGTDCYAGSSGGVNDHCVPLKFND